MSSAIIASSREEKEKLLNIRIEQIKKKNEELLNKHKLIEEDKRLAELQGRTIKIIKPSGYEDEGVIDKVKTAHARKENHEVSKHALQDNKLPLEPTYNFLFDKMRDGPSPKEDRQERNRRHPRNYGGINFEDVPRKIQQERAKQNNHGRHNRSNEVDYSFITTGKERRQMDEWRKQREEIDKNRMQRQMKEDGGWKREWDQNKDSSFAESDSSSGIRSGCGDQKFCAKMWTGAGPHRHYNKVYHQKRRVKRNASDPSSAYTMFEGGNDNRKFQQTFSKRASPAVSDSSEQPHCSTPSSSEELNGKHKNMNGRHEANLPWRSKRATSESQQWRKNSPAVAAATTTTTELRTSDSKPPQDDSDKNASSSSPRSPRKSVRFLEVGGTKDSPKSQETSSDLVLVRTSRNVIGSGRFSGGQKLKGKGNKQRRDFNVRSVDGKSGSQIRKVYLNEAMCKSVEVVVKNQDSLLNGGASASQETQIPSSAESHATSDVLESAKQEEPEKKSDEDEYDDEDEQWEDIDEEVCLELDHGREELNIDASSESLDQFIVNNTLKIDVAEPSCNGARALGNDMPKFDGDLDDKDASMGSQGCYPSVLDWEDDAESISQLSDAEKCNSSDASAETSARSNGSTEEDVPVATQTADMAAEEAVVGNDADGGNEMPKKTIPGGEADKAEGGNSLAVDGGPPLEDVGLEEKRVE